MNAAYLGTPDLCTSGLVCKATGPLIRILSGGATLRVFATFGAVLGLACFSKTIMFLVAFAFLAAAGRRRETILAFACFAVIVLPWITTGTALHPPWIIHTSPEVREFATPFRATYPPWYNIRIGCRDSSALCQRLPTTNSQEGGWQNDSETDFWCETSE